MNAPRLLLGVPKSEPRLLRQVVVATQVGLSTLRQRIGGAAVVIVSLAVVILAMFPGLMVADAMRRGLAEEGRPDRAVLLSAGARWEFDSGIPSAWIGAIKAAPGVARDTQGAPLADAQFDLHCLGGLRNPRKGKGVCVNLIGMEPAGRAMRPDIRLLAGRWPRPGQRELIAGVRATQVYDQLAVGKRLRVTGYWDWGAKHIVSDGWRVVGTFSTDNSFFDANAVTVAGTLRAVAELGDASTIVVQLTSPAEFDRFHAAIAANPALRVSVERQTDYYRRLGWSLPRAAVILEILIGTLLGAGAMAGIIHIMLITVESREGEIAVLRALGFHAGAAAASVVLEAMLLALAGALLGLAILWFWLGGHMLAGVLPLTINASLTARAIGWAWGIALLGATMPALRAARMEVAEALRSR
jgi:putative ABC transport system permease protein